jgi:SAM-dependent methyltransferase
MNTKLDVTLKKNVFDEMGIYWMEIADQNQTKCQIQLIKNTLKSQGLVLDLACGSGRHLIALSKEGYGVVGLDISLKLLKIAKNRWHEANVIRADMRFLPFKPQSFAATVSMDQSFGYLPSEQDDIKSLRELHDALSTCGILIVDMFNRERLIKQSKGSQPKWREYPSFFLQQTRSLEANGGTLHDLWVVCDKADGQTLVFEHVVRLYTLESLRDLLEKAGFNVKAVNGDYEMQNFSVNSSRLIMVAIS